MGGGGGRSQLLLWPRVIRLPTLFLIYFLLSSPVDEGKDRCRARATGTDAAAAVAAAGDDALEQK